MTHSHKLGCTPTSRLCPMVKVGSALIFACLIAVWMISVAPRAECSAIGVYPPTHCNNTGTSTPSIDVCWVGITPTNSYQSIVTCPQSECGFVGYSGGGWETP